MSRPAQSKKKPVASQKRSTKPPEKTVKSLTFVISCLLLSILGAFFVAVLFLRLIGWHVFMDSKNTLGMTQGSELSGVVHFTALKPEPEDKGELSIYARRADSESWEPLKVPMPLKQDASWQWLKAYPGVNYELQAVLVIDGVEIKRSEVVTTTAPAINLELPIHITWHDLPEDVVSGSTTLLVGSVQLNGYVPAGSMVEVYALDEAHYGEELHQVTPQVLADATRVATAPVSHATAEWSWDQAVPLEQYMLIAVLKNQNQTIGLADRFILADAGQETIQHVINSTAPAPAGMVSIPGVSTLQASLRAQSAGSRGLSGTVTVVGPKQKDTSLLLLQRKSGEQNFTAINRYMYPTHLGTRWQWPDAQPGQSYEITAALQVDDQNTSTPPNPTTVTAPASKIDFSLNTWYTIKRPDDKPVNEVCVDGDSNSYVAVLRLPRVADASQYWLQVGDQPSTAGTYNQMFPVTDASQDPKVRVRVQKGKQYSMRYAYATCDHCSSAHNFSPYSDEVGFTCD